MMKRIFAALLLAGAQLAGIVTAANGNANEEKIIISGASGQLGGLTIKELLARGVKPANLILVSRTPDSLAEYAKRGASVRFGDVDKPESLSAAYAGGTRMLMISLGFGPGAPPRPPRHKIAFDAAVKAGVKHIVYTSFVGADTGTSTLAKDHMESEGYLRASGARWTMLRNGFYADGQLQRAIDMAKTGKVTVPPNEPKSAPVTRADCAAAAAGALLTSWLKNEVFEVTGPEAINRTDLAKMVGEIIGRPIEIIEQAAPAPGAPAGPPPAPPGPMAAPMITDAVAVLAGRPATSVRALLEANRAQILAAVPKT